VKKEGSQSKNSSLIYNTKHQLNKLIKGQLISCTVAGNSDPACAAHAIGLEAGETPRRVVFIAEELVLFLFHPMPLLFVFCF